MPRIFIPEVVSQAVMVLNVSGMEAFSIQFQVPKSLPAADRQILKFGF
jgi:hypothetical protein